MPVQNFESLNASTDVATTRTLLHESIPLTGAIVSGTYNEGAGTTETNIKNYTHGMFQSVFDYPYLSSSANHIFDLTIGYDEGSTLSASTNTQNSKKINMYNQFAQILLGYTGAANTVEIFESDLLIGDNNNQMDSVFFINFSRLLTKDEVKPGSFSITIGTGSWLLPFDTSGSSRVAFLDASASSTQGTANTIGGDYGVLYQDNGDATYGDGVSGSGVVFYQAGIAILTSSVFVATPDFYPAVLSQGGGAQTVNAAFTGSSISASCDALRHRIYNLSFNNSTELNSAIYFCRVPHNKYNYSSNPTYQTGSKIRVKSVASDTPITYVTTIGLYNASNELLAVAKLSEPLKKDPTNDITLRVRLDY